MDIELVEKVLYLNEYIVEQLSEEWFNLRIGKITGSKFMDLMPTPSQRREWTDKQISFLQGIASEALTGIKPSINTTTAMKWGTETEAEARTWYELLTMQTVRECGFFKVNDFVGVSPDGIIESENMVWECKCPNSSTHLSYLLDPEKLYKKYKWQVIGEMMATGLNKAVIVSYDPRFKDDKKKMVMYHTELKKEDLEALNYRLEKAVEIIKELVA